LTISNVNPNTSEATISRVGSSNGAGWVKIVLAGVELARYDVWVGGPVATISGPTSVTVGVPGQSSGNSYTTSLVSLAAGTITNQQWNLSPMNSSFLFDYGNWANIYFDPAGSYEVSYRAYATCGWGPWAYKGVWAYDYSPSPSYPNPVNDILTIETGASVKGVSQTYDVRLYDGQGNLLRQASNKGGTVQFNVSALPDGIYYLHIYDGVSSTPEMQQIVVQH
jgi:hypothetical protein